MEPVDYLKVLKNHWKVVGALIVLAVSAIYFTSPKSASKAYTATHVLRLEQIASQGDGDSSTSNSNVLSAAMLVEGGEVPRRVAEALGYDDAPAVSDKVEAVGVAEVGTITITAHGGSKAEAIALANGVGAEFVKFIAELEENRVAADIGRNGEAKVAIQQEIDAKEAQLNTDPNNIGVQEQLRSLYGQLANLSTNPSDYLRTTYVSMQEAVGASEDAGLVAGFGREQRALIAAVFGALAGFGVAIMLDRSDSRLRTKDQVERRFGMPVLAEVPLLPLRDRSRAAVVAFEREPRVAEAYRGLRTALLLFRSRTEQGSATNGNGHSNGHSAAAAAQSAAAVRQLVVVTSPEAGDGKSTTTANLAMAYAEAGQSVLLVSWDLWRPLSPGVFDAQEGPGVADYLDGTASSLVRYVQDTSIPGVRIVTAGLGGHHPYTQIENARRLLEEARTLANIVIVDTAPILSASVTRELVTLADAVVVVCRAGRTTGPAADRCAELLERLGAPALGVVLVGVATGPFADYYGAPPKETRGLERAGFRRRSEDAAARHKAASGTGTSLRPTSAQYRATAPRGSEGREPR